jgi:pseudouridine synthase
VASRRAAEEMIAAGRVSVNGQVVTEMGRRANPLVDKIEVDGKPVRAPQVSSSPEAHVYIMLNKPEGVVTTTKDTHGRPTVLDVLAGASGEGKHPGERVYPVGRLDADTTGLLLLTNDGEITFRLTHPRYKVEKEYHALVRGHPADAQLQRLRDGIEIEGEQTAPAKAKAIEQAGPNTRVRVVIHEGRKRQVRLMFAAIGHPVIELRRVRFGPLFLGDLPPGKWRRLAVHEIHALRKAVRMPTRDA